MESGCTMGRRPVPHLQDCEPKASYFIILQSRPCQHFLTVKNCLFIVVLLPGQLLSMTSANNSNAHDSCHPFRIIRVIEGDGESARVEDFQVRTHPDLIVLITN